MEVTKAMEEAFSSAFLFTQQRSEQPMENRSRRGGIQNPRESALPRRASRTPIHQVNLTGFICEPGDPEYAEAAKATGKKGNVPIYWFKQRRYDNEFFEEIDSVHEIDTISQAERDAILYPHAVKKSDAASTQTKPRRKSLTPAMRDLMSKGKEKKVHFVEETVKDDNNQSLDKPTEEENRHDNPDVEMVEEPEWI